jgi:nucleoside-diphosphate-sugar epimerase
VRILLTGSSGRVGTAIANSLSADHEVFGIDRAPGPHTTHIANNHDRGLVDELASQADAMVHTASLHAPHVGRVADQTFVETNVHGTEVLLHACLRHGVQRFVYTSTMSLYGHALVPADRAVWVTEDLVPRPRDIYDTTKIAAEEACRAASGTSLTCVSLRIARCFPEPAEQLAIYRLHRGIDLRDVAEAHRLALTADLPTFELLNVAAATPFAISDARALFLDATTVIRNRIPWAAAAFEHRGWRLPRSIDRVYATDKARLMLGYRPRFNFDSLFETDIA